MRVLENLVWALVPKWLELRLGGIERIKGIMFCMTRPKIQGNSTQRLAKTIVAANIVAYVLLTGAVALLPCRLV